MHTAGVLIASARPQSVGARVASLVAERLADRWTVSTLDLGRIALPNYDGESSPRQGPPHTGEHAVAWSRTVDELDAIVVVTPEYNGSIPGSLKTAVDYLYGEWQRKPVGIVGYGWQGAAGAIAESERLFGVVGADVVGSVALGFRTDLEADGSMHLEAATDDRLDAMLTALGERATAAA